MLPQWHAFLGIIFAFIIHTLFPGIHMFYIVLLFASSVLIDVDHYLYYAIKYKDISLKKAYNYFVNDFYINPFCVVLHVIEFLFILAILSFVHNIFFFMFIGAVFHVIVDLISCKERIYWGFSFLLYFCVWRKKW